MVQRRFRRKDSGIKDTDQDDCERDNDTGRKGEFFDVADKLVFDTGNNYITKNIYTKN